MELNEIKILLDRYWNCETSPEEEEKIRNFFLQQEVPDSLNQYKNYFLWIQTESDKKADEEWFLKIIKQLDGIPNPKKKKKGYFYPFLRIAASVLIVIASASGIYTHYMEQMHMEETEQTYTDTYTDPEIAREKAKDVLSKVSFSLSKGEHILLENFPTDSVKDLE